MARSTTHQRHHSSANFEKDLLDEFSAAKLGSQQPIATSGPGRPSTAPKEDEVGEDVLSDDDFAKQLQAGMANLLGELESSVGRHHAAFLESMDCAHYLLA